MCGIIGFLGYDNTNIEHIANEMTHTLHHRGPDDHGIWCDPKIQIALGHARLSILDLTSAGHQPMISHHGRYILAFNGEIYNHLSLRKELESNTVVSWRGHSDTETLLEAIEQWGFEKTLKKTVGMFAISLWDTKEQNLYLARDRMGEKPLYYGFQNKTFMFASELKALKKHPSFQSKINRDAIALQLQHGYIPDPYSIYEGIQKLHPGHFITLNAKTNEISDSSYWSLSETVENAKDNPFQGNISEMIFEVERVLKEAVRSQMIADVPLGAFLSGGIDSSLVTALMQSESNTPTKTFTIGFNEKGYNEAEFAKTVAKHLKTDHTELYVTERDALNVIPLLPSLYDEPFSDSSQIPTFLVSQMTKQHVTVALSGDGADELFGGYNRYFWANTIWNRIGFLPHGMRSHIADLLLLSSPDTLNAQFETLSHFLPKKFRYKNFGDKLHKLADILAISSKENIYMSLISHWNSSENVVINSNESNVVHDKLINKNNLDFISQMMYADAVSYLPGDILTKVDRAGMGVSLETRMPFLDHRVIETAWRLPMNMKIQAGQGKWILRQILYKYVPKEMIDRPKMGFGAPIDSWLRGPLRDWAEELLNEDRLKREGFLNPAPIRQKWEEHLSKKRNWQYHLWNVLMFQAWLEDNQ
jgi:asparagine synthase (glutamine-hydrolysing)